MVDDPSGLTPQPPVTPEQMAADAGPLPPGAPTPEPKKGGGLKDFFAVPRNRVITIVAAVVLLLGMLAAVAVIVLMVFTGKPATPVPSAGVTQGQTGAGVAPSASGGAAKPTKTTPPVQVSLDIPPSFEVFAENKDPFKPGLVPTEGGGGTDTETATGGGDTTSTGGESTETIRPGNDVLYLHEIVWNSDDGERHAIVYWDNERYEVAEGDRVDDSPWKVVSIGSSSATFLYGDDRITLRVGEQLGK